MQKQKIHPGTILMVFFSLAALEALICTIYLLIIPADPKNQIILGYSLPRLIVVGIFLLLFLSCIVLVVKIFSNQRQAEDCLERILDKKNAAVSLFNGSIVLFWIGWIISFTPSYRFGELGTYYLRSQPVFIWITLFSAQTLLLLLVYRYGVHFDPIKKELTTSRSIFWAGSIPFLLGLLIWLAVAVLGFKIVTDNIFWNETGVPLLAIQVLLTWGVGTAVVVGYIFVNSHRQDWLIAFRKSPWISHS